jgi:hypothetical protein
MIIPIATSAATLVIVVAYGYVRRSRMRKRAAAEMFEASRRIACDATFDPSAYPDVAHHGLQRCMCEAGHPLGNRPDKPDHYGPSIAWTNEQSRLAHAAALARIQNTPVDDKDITP